MAVVRLTRRQLLAAGLAGSAVLAVGAYGGYRLLRRRQQRRRPAPPREQPFAPSAFVAIDAQGLVTLWVPRPEVGQGIATTLPMLVVEELGADPAKVKVVQAPADEAYGSQMTAVSAGVRNSFKEQLAAGAAARQMLVRAAAATLDRPAAEFRVELGEVIHGPSGRRMPFAELVHAAAKQRVPDDPPLKPRSEWRYVGKAMPRLDLPAKIDGSARFGIDVRIAGMLFATVARPPAVGGKAGRFDARDALAVPGVRKVIAIESGIAVVADHTYSAMLGRQALKVDWEAGPNSRWDARAIDAHLDQCLGREGAIARREGNGAKGLQGPGRLVRAEYRLPYLAHATMEPMNCTADVRADECVVWAPSQAPQTVREAVARRLGIPVARVAVNIPLIGGAFGRRVANDYVFEAVDISKAVGRPVQVLWTREDDIRHDGYRPCSAHRLEARLDADGLPLAIAHRIAAPSILRNDPAFKDPVDPTAVEGAKEIPYRVADLQVEYSRADLPMRVGFWRSVGHSYNAFAVECFMDEIAAAGGQDPVALRRRLLPSGSRHLAVLEAAVAKAGAAPAGPGRGRGVAVHGSYGSYVAMVADVRVEERARVRVERVVCAADCGLAVNPDGAAAQLEGGILFGLTAALHGRVDFEAGAASTSNFDDSPLLRFDEAPAIEVVHVNGAPDQLGGVGEIGVPPIAPAVCNAIFRASGARPRTLPLDRGFGASA
jgi:isoquinoline 1-oxidoreductase beta subunit